MPLNAELIKKQVSTALMEDVGTGDLTALLIPPHAKHHAHVISREAGVLAGQAWFDSAFQQLDDTYKAQWAIADGTAFQPGTILCELWGSSRALLSAERTALNFLQTLSGIATTTHTYVERIKPYKTCLLDTRKTIPGLRMASKYAVTCGGGENHRFGLYDCIMLKENHLSHFTTIEAAVSAARQMPEQHPVIIEVETQAQLLAALSAQPDRILCDNFDLPALSTAVETAAGQVPLEASGNVTLETIKPIAATGVDYISVGRLTKKITPLDLTLLSV